VSGLASDSFLFLGFPNRNKAARRAEFEGLAGEHRTMLFYESSHRVKACLRDMVDIFGAERPGVVARELTKLHETILHDTLGSLFEVLERDPMQSRGEFVLIVSGRSEKPSDELGQDVIKTLKLLMQELSLKQAAALTAKLTGEKKNRLYQYGLGLQDDVSE
jgi:16S rRNA (cytidine1402-2'-O)-methyltransferase